MARIRSIKPEFWGDRKLASSVSRDARLLYIGLWNQADEWGRVNGDIRWIKGHVFPYDDDLDLDRVTDLLEELVNAGRVQRYIVDGDPFLYLPKLSAHQRLEPQKVESKIPAPPDAPTDADSSESRADNSAPRADEPEKKDALHVAGSMEPGAGSRVVARRSDDAAPAQDTDPTGRLLIAHNVACGSKLTPSQLTPVRTAIARLVGEGVAETDIAAGLTRMRDRGLSARMLPELVVEATYTRPSTTDQRVATGLGLVEKYRAQEAT